MDALKARIADLSARMDVMEDAYRRKRSGDSNALHSNGEPGPAMDAFACNMMVRAIANGFSHTTFVRCPDDYYDWTLEKRRRYLGAPTTQHLTKSIVMQNTRYEGVHGGSDPLRAKYICVVVQYDRMLDSDLLTKVMQSVFKKANGENGNVPGIKNFNFRLAEDCVGISGYTPNGVTPLGLKTPMPIVIDERITQLIPDAFWLGGGEVSLKWRVKLDEFKQAFHPIAGKVSVSESE